MRAYGSDPFSYDFEAALEDARTGLRPIGAERVYDKRANGGPRLVSDLPPIVGLFEGSRCRRCDAYLGALVEEEDPRPCAFCKAAPGRSCEPRCKGPHDTDGMRRLSGKEMHRLSHEWQDENRRLDETSDELEHAYLAACRPPQGYELDPEHRVLELVPPTPAQLQRHREKFEPPTGQKFADARLKHRKACDEVARLYGLSGDDLERMLLDLRNEGLSVAEISERCGVPEGKVRMIVRGGGKRGSKSGSGARKTSSRGA